MLLIDPMICLAAALYFEARGELRIDQLRVAEVIYNREESIRYPNNICDVVKQDQQFTFYWDGKEEIIKDKEAWELSVEYAGESLKGEISMPGFCHYAHKEIDNKWTRALAEGKETHGSHSFYKGGC